MSLTMPSQLQSSMVILSFSDNMKDQILSCSGMRISSSNNIASCWHQSVPVKRRNNAQTWSHHSSSLIPVGLRILLDEKVWASSTCCAPNDDAVFATYLSHHEKTRRIWRDVFISSSLISWKSPTSPSPSQDSQHLPLRLGSVRPDKVSFSCLFCWWLKAKPKVDKSQAKPAPFFFQPFSSIEDTFIGTTSTFHRLFLFLYFFFSILLPCSFLLDVALFKSWVLLIRFNSL